jgi:hypothetical protein
MAAQRCKYCTIAATESSAAIAVLNRSLPPHGHPNELDKVRGDSRGSEAADTGILPKTYRDARSNIDPYRGIKESTSIVADP